MIWSEEIEKKLENPETRFETVCELVRSSQDGIKKAIENLVESAGLLYAIEIVIAGKAHADRTRDAIQNAAICQLTHHTEETAAEFQKWESEETISR